MAGRPGRRMQLRHLDAAAIHRVRAARVEPATGRRIQQRRRLARDLHETIGIDVHARQRAQQPPGVRMARCRVDLVHGGLLDRPAGVHHDHVVGDLGDDPEVVRDHDDRRAVLRLQLAHQLEDLRLRRHVERGRRLVRDQQVGVVDQRHRDHHALPHAARELVRVVVDPLAGLRDPHLAERRHGAVARLLLGDVVVEQHRLAQLPADRLDRVQRGHRILEDHRDLLPPQLAQAILARGEQVLAVEHRLAARGRVARVVQAHDRERRDALAAPGLADDPERLVSVDRERDAVHRLDDAVVGLEARAQVADLEERHQLSRILGSNQA